MKKEDVKLLPDLLKEADGIIAEISAKRERLSEIRDNIDNILGNELDVINEYLREG